MANKFASYCYQKHAVAKNAFLFNCRDTDVVPKTGKSIPQGAIVSGAVGFVAAEQIVPGFSGKVVSFKPNRRCLWGKIEMRCMVAPGTPQGKSTKKQLRDFNYIVAEVPNIKAAHLVKGMPVVKNSKGQMFMNLEIGCFGRQGRKRRAKLL